MTRPQVLRNLGPSNNGGRAGMDADTRLVSCREPDNVLGSVPDG